MQSTKTRVSLHYGAVVGRSEPVLPFAGLCVWRWLCWHRRRWISRFVRTVTSRQMSRISPRLNLNEKLFAAMIGLRVLCLRHSDRLSTKYSTQLSPTTSRTIPGFSQQVYGIQWRRGSPTYSVYQAWHDSPKQLLEMTEYKGIAGLRKCRL